MLATLVILRHFYISKEALIVTLLTRVSNVSWPDKQFQNFSDLSTTEVFFIHVTEQGVEIVLFTSVGSRLLLSSSFSTFYSHGAHHWTLSIELAEKESSEDCRKFKSRA